MIDEIKFCKIQEKDATDRTWETVAIFINNREIVDIINEAEIVLWDEKSEYIHQLPSDLYIRLKDAIESDEYNHEAEILCCICGVIECWSPIVHISVDENYIYWDKFTHNHLEGTYNLSFKFNKLSFMNEFEKLKKWAQE